MGRRLGLGGRAVGWVGWLAWVAGRPLARLSTAGREGDLGIADPGVVGARAPPPLTRGPGTPLSKESRVTIYFCFFCPLSKDSRMALILPERWQPTAKTPLP